MQCDGKININFDNRRIVYNQAIDHLNVMSPAGVEPQSSTYHASNTPVVMEESTEVMDDSFLALTDVANIPAESEGRQFIFCYLTGYAVMRGYK